MCRGKMHQNAIFLTIILLITCKRTESLFNKQTKEVGHAKNTDEGYFHMIRSTHALKKRDVYSIDTVSVPAGGKPNDETIIIMPNSGMNYPYSNYQTNPYSRYGSNSGPTVIVSNPGGNYNNGYGTKYIPNKYG